MRNSKKLLKYNQSFFTCRSDYKAGFASNCKLKKIFHIEHDNYRQTLYFKKQPSPARQKLILFFSFRSTEKVMKWKFRNMNISIQSGEILKFYYIFNWKISIIFQKLFLLTDQMNWSSNKRFPIWDIQWQFSDGCLVREHIHFADDHILTAPHCHRHRLLIHVYHLSNPISI